MKLSKRDYIDTGYPAFSAAGQDGFVDRWEHDGQAIVVSSIGARCGKSFFASGKWTSLANTQDHFIFGFEGSTRPGAGVTAADSPSVHRFWRP